VYEKLISQLAHVELITPDLEGSARFFVDVLGLDECGREGDTIYLRCWSDYFRHSVELTAGPQPALGHIAWRAQGPDQLRDAVARIDAAGLGEGWRESGFGHGRAYRYCGPGGHVQEIFWDVERYAASPEMRSPFPNRPQRLIARGVACRQLDHVTVVTPKPYEDAEWYRDNLNYRFTEYTVAAGRDDLCGGACTIWRSGWTSPARSHAPPTFSSTAAQRSRPVPDVMGSGSSHIYTSVSPAGCGSRSTPAAIASTSQTGRRSAGRPLRALTFSTATFPTHRHR
jgi:catechol 2,3-dioxygenase-like lactoylglutathione lyase family enzyme